MSRLRIALIGREAPLYVEAFRDHDCRVIERAEDISAQDDLVFALSFPRLIPAEILARPRHGVFVNHSSDLPRGRGWAPLQWSVLKGLIEVTVTLFKAVPEADAGPWAFKQSFPIERHDTLDSLYAKDREVSIALFRKLIEAVQSARLTLHTQEGEPTHWPKRGPADSELDPSRSLSELWDHIRVCDNERYPAFFMIDGRKVTLRYDVTKAEP